MNRSAGLDLVTAARRYDAALPVLLQSATDDGSPLANAATTFVDKKSPSLLAEIRAFLQDSLGFGDFVFRDGSGP